MNRRKLLYDKWNNFDFYDEPRPRRKPEIDTLAWRKVSNAPRLFKVALEILETGTWLVITGGVLSIGLIAGLSNQFAPGLPGAYALLALFMVFFIAVIISTIGLIIGGLFVELRERRQGKIVPRYTADQILDKYGFNPDKTPKQPVPKTRLRNGPPPIQERQS